MGTMADELQKLSANYSIELQAETDENMKRWLEYQLEEIRKHMFDYRKLMRWAKIEDGFLIFYLDREGAPCFTRSNPTNVRRVYSTLSIYSKIT